MMLLRTSQKLLKAQRNIPISVIVIFFEHIRHSLQYYTALHKQIEAHTVLAAFVVRLIQQMDKSGGEAVAKGNERFRVLVEGYVAALVLIEAIEEGTPGSEETPEAATNMSALPTKTTKRDANVPEFFKIYTPVFIRIKHPYHHLDRMRIKTRKVPIDERLPQLSFRQLARPHYIDCLEKRKKRRVSAAAAGGRCPRRSRGRWWTPMVSLWRRIEAITLGWGR